MSLLCCIVFSMFLFYLEESYFCSFVRFGRHAKGGATSGGRKQKTFNQSLANAIERRGENLLSKRKQSRANADNCKQMLTPTPEPWDPFGHSGGQLSPNVKKSKNQKNLRAHKNKIGTPNPPPPKKGNFTDRVFPAERTRFFPGVHKIGAPISGPRIADTNFTDTKRIFLKKKSRIGFPGPPGPGGNKSEKS